MGGAFGYLGAKYQVEKSVSAASEPVMQTEGGIKPVEEAPQSTNREYISDEVTAQARAARNAPNAAKISTDVPADNYNHGPFIVAEESSAGEAAYGQQSFAAAEAAPPSGGNPVLSQDPYNPDVVNTRSAEFYKMYGDSPNRGTMSDVEARNWYLFRDAKIMDVIDTTKPLDVQARQAFDLRNQYRTEARDLMSNRITADRLSREEPNMTWDEMLEYRRSQGLAGDDIYRAILKSSQRTRAEVNERLR
jgi:filamentous hemagglutinin